MAISGILASRVWGISSVSPRLLYFQHVLHLISVKKMGIRVLEKPLGKLVRFAKALQKRLLRPGSLRSDCLAERTVRDYRLCGYRRRPSVENITPPRNTLARFAPPRTACLLRRYVFNFRVGRVRVVTWSERQTMSLARLKPPKREEG